MHNQPDNPVTPEDDNEDLIDLGDDDDDEIDLGDDDDDCMPPPASANVEVAPEQSTNGEDDEALDWHGNLDDIDSLRHTQYEEFVSIEEHERLVREREDRERISQLLSSEIMQLYADEADKPRNSSSRNMTRSNARSRFAS